MIPPFKPSLAPTLTPLLSSSGSPKTAAVGYYVAVFCLLSFPVLQLKDMFPGFRLSLPPKRWFKDNYDSSFLEDRQLGLQAFLQNLIAHKDIANWYELALL